MRLLRILVRKERSLPRGFTLAARFSGKVKAVVQGIAAQVILILILMIPFAMGLLSLPALQTSAFYITCAAVIYSIFSGIEYLKANQSYIKKALVK